MRTYDVVDWGVCLCVCAHMNVLLDSRVAARPFIICDTSERSRSALYDEQGFVQPDSRLMNSAVLQQAEIWWINRLEFSGDVRWHTVRDRVRLGTCCSTPSQMKKQALKWSQIVCPAEYARHDRTIKTCLEKYGNTMELERGRADTATKCSDLAKTQCIVLFPPFLFLSSQNEAK